MKTKNKMDKTVELKIENNIASIILKKKPLNILSITDLKELNNILNYINKAQNIKIVVIKSALKDFSAGVDINEHNTSQINEILSLLNESAELLLNCKYPTITIIKGLCLGGGMEITLLTDITLSSEKAKLGQPEIKLAHIAPFAINLLPEITGIKKATELILTGEIISANDALNYNLINKVYNDQEFEEKCNNYIEKLLELSQAALLANIKTLRLSKINNVNNNLSQIENIYLKDLINHPDSMEGITAFKEKRAPKWTH